MNNPFWEYSVQQYARSGVAEACLALQDEHGLDVNMLLYGAWLASIGRQPDSAHLEAMSRDIREWRERVVQPLRHLRRQWKGFAPAAQLRDQLQAIELAAERAQQDRMLAVCRTNPPPDGAPAILEANLCLVAESTGLDGRGWRPLVTRLAGLLEA